MSNKVTFRVDVEDAAALQKFLKLTHAEREVEMQTKRTSKAMKDKGTAARGATSNIDKMVKAGLAIGAVTAVVKKGTDAWLKYQEHLKGVAEGANQSADAMRAFVALQPEGAEGRKHVAKSILMGAAELAMRPEEAATVAQPIQSLVDKGTAGLDAKERAEYEARFRAAGTLMNLGVAAADASEIAKTGKSRGLRAGRAEDLVVAAASKSAYGEDAFAKAIPGTAQFSTMEQGLAAVSIMSREMNAERLRAAAEAGSRALGVAADDTKFTKKFGLKGLTESQRVQKLAAIGAEMPGGVEQFSKSFKAYGLGDEEARAVGALVRHASDLGIYVRELNQQKAGITQGRLETLLQDPNQAAAFAARQREALRGAGQLYGIDAERGREKSARNKAAGAIMEASGFGAFVDDKGNAGWFDTMVVALGEKYFLPKLAAIDNRFAQVETRIKAGELPSTLESVGNVENLRQSNEILTKAIERLINTIDADITTTPATNAQE